MGLGQILELGESVRKVGFSNRRLYVDRCDEERIFIPLEDINLIIVDGKKALLSAQALSALSDSNIPLLVTDSKHLPVGCLSPLAAHVYHPKRLQLQITAREHLKRKAWTQLVKAKIVAQRDALKLCGRDASVLLGFENKVKSGDPKNVEAQAAKRYWRELFRGNDFYRSNENDGRNILLNYGYSILRSTIARAICASGLHPALGIYHSNRGNSFALADDFIEPLRPLVDIQIAELQLIPEKEALTRENKGALLSILFSEIYCDTGVYEFSGGVKVMLDSYVQLMCSERRELIIPRIVPHD